MHNIKVMSRQQADKDINNYSLSVSSIIYLVDKNTDTIEFKNDTNKYFIVPVNKKEQGISEDIANKIAVFVKEAEDTCISFVVVSDDESKANGIAAGVSQVLDGTARYFLDNPNINLDMKCYGLIKKFS